MRLGLATTILCIILQLCYGFAEDDQCARDQGNITQVDADYGSREAYYDIGQGISKGLQKSLSSGDLNSLGKLWNNDGDVAVQDAVDAFMKVFKKQVGAIIFLAIGALYIILMPIFGIIFCCCRCQGRCGGKGKTPKFANACSKWSLPIYLSVLAASLALLVVGMIMYGLSIQDTDDNIDYVGDKTKLVSEDVKTILGDGSDEISCRAKVAVSVVFNDTIKNITDFRDATFNEIDRKYNFSSMQQMLSDQPKVDSQITNANKSVEEAIQKLPPGATATLKQLNDLQGIFRTISKDFDNAMGNVKNTSDKFVSDMGKAKSEVNRAIDDSRNQSAKSQDSVDKSVDSIYNTVSDVQGRIDSISNMLTKVQKDVDTFSGRSAVVHGSKAIVLAPATFVAFPAFLLLIFGILRVFQNICKLKFLSKFTTAGGYIAAFGLVFAFLFGWIIMFFASISFFGGFGIEAICKPLFRDDKMEIFQYVKYLNFTIPNSIDTSKDVTVNFGEILRQCRDNSTIFAAVKGSNLINKEDITKNIDFETNRKKIDDSIDKNNFAFDFGDTDLTKINKDRENLEAQINQIDETGLPNDTQQAIRNVKTSATTLIGSLSIYGDKLTELINDANTSKSFVNETKNGVDNLFNNLKSDFPRRIDSGVNDLNEKAYPCRPVYDVWQTVGVLGCDRMGRPIQGVWMSTGLIAVIYIPTIIMMIIISGILYQIDKKDPYSKHKHGHVEDERVPITQPTPRQRQQQPLNGYMYNRPAQPVGAQNNYYYAGNPNYRPASMYPQLTSSGSGQQAQYY